MTIFLLYIVAFFKYICLFSESKCAFFLLLFMYYPFKKIIFAKLEQAKYKYKLICAMENNFELSFMH